MQTVPRSQTLTVQIEHDQQHTTEYALLLNSTEIARKPIAEAGVQFTLDGGLHPGQYELLVQAIGPAGMAVSDPVLLQVVGTHPARPKITVTVE